MTTVRRRLGRGTAVGKLQRPFLYRGSAPRGRRVLSPVRVPECAARARPARCSAPGSCPPRRSCASRHISLRFGGF